MNFLLASIGVVSFISISYLIQKNTDKPVPRPKRRHRRRLPSPSLDSEDEFDCSESIDLPSKRSRSPSLEREQLESRLTELTHAQPRERLSRGYARETAQNALFQQFSKIHSKRQAPFQEDLGEQSRSTPSAVEETVHSEVAKTNEEDSVHQSLLEDEEWLN